MEGAKQYLKEQNILPRLSFKDGLKHVLKLIDSKSDTINDGNNIIKGIKVLVEENGEKKTFFTSSESLISKLSEIAENTVVVIELKSRKDQDGQFKSIFSVSVPSTSIPEKDIPEESEDTFDYVNSGI